jgi:hypothetical protein
VNWLLLVDNALALVGWAFFVEWEIRANVALIKADGSQDSLHEEFHASRTWLRLRWWLGLSLAGVVLAGSWPAAGLSFAGLAQLLGGYFVRTFNPRLNVGRALAYVGRFYVSFAPRAALWPDRFLAKLAVKRYPLDTVAQRKWADARLQLLLNGILAASLLLYVLLTWRALRLAPMPFS